MSEMMMYTMFAIGSMMRITAVEISKKSHNFQNKLQIGKV